MMNVLKKDDIIAKLRNTKSEYTNDDFTFLVDCFEIDLDNLSSNILSYSSSYLFDYFMYCIDWRHIYGLNFRMTTYDILIGSLEKVNEESVRKENFQELYQQLINIFKGKLSTSEEVEVCYNKVVSQLRRGIKLLACKKNGCKENKCKCKIPQNKGLVEFFKGYLEFVLGLSYAYVEPSTPFLSGDYQETKFKVFLWEKFIPAHQIAKCFNEYYKIILENRFNIKVDTYFALHVFVKHVVPFKTIFEYDANEYLKNYKLKHPSKHQGVNITAYPILLEDNVMATMVTEKVGVFYYPLLSSKLNEFDTADFCNFHKTAKMLYTKIEKILPIFLENIYIQEKPNIIFYENELYGIEFYENEEKLIEIGSFYPLNSDLQLKEGITKEEYNKITNKKDIPPKQKLRLRLTGKIA
ncbi:hypothetical protein Fleli_0119 [Bernardetia litoralis DSM 6794]|uniref:Uncharacterized protein n=1 Tax=Bernardetia litoralis (strain ATCC 23117 / DSM 6794 / NBRC 15988 / NCIMB 1366 / Fx l1 / Sio-4) TaxID=880071 RepID=I4AF84_BERLS|nr:hypothetical protein [Bernardetia litoralis]AFM02619.1 hypothetical protein Fleli_0119 [Bernardetia litoralis DSM 6794]